MSVDTNTLTYLLTLKPIEFDTILSLVGEKYNQLQKLPLKRRKQLNIMFGVNYMNDYENCLYEIKHKMESIRYDEQ